MVSMRFLAFLFATAALAQTPPPDTQALQPLVNEIRQLRIDLQTTTITTQRVQIVLYRLQSQTTLVTRAASHLEEIRSSLARLESDKQGTSARQQQLEEALRTIADNAERKHLEGALAETKAAIERLAADEQRLQSRVVDAETQHRAEQAKLAELQDQLDRLDKVLDSLMRK
jgi:septal ring factor EnvC (AmiA/AmiB activator)